MSSFNMRYGIPVTNLDAAKDLLRSLADPDHQVTEIGELGIDAYDVAAACTIVLQRLKQLEDRLEGKQLAFRPSLRKAVRAYQNSGEGWQ